MSSPTETTPLRPAGRFESQLRRSVAPRSLAELKSIVSDAHVNGERLTIAGGMRSFGDQFLPVDDDTGAQKSLVLLLKDLPRDVSLLSHEEDGSVWVSASGWCSFGDLLEVFPRHVPFAPPTSKQVTLAGALAAATHSVIGYFADSVRKFWLLLPSGEVVECSPGAVGKGGELFALSPGSYGALGLVTRMELRLRPIATDEFVEVSVLGRGRRSELPRLLQRLEEVHHENEYPTGKGLYICRGGKEFVLFGDRTRRAGERPRRQLPLLGGSATQNIVIQGLSSRFPTWSQRLQPFGLRPGRQFWADPVQFQFFQESYDLTFDWLSAKRWGPRLLRSLGILAELPVAHQTWAVEPRRVEGFLDLYLQMLSDNSDAAPFLELQDLIRLPRSSTQLHPLSAYPDGGYLFTPSASLNRGSFAAEVSENFFREFSRRAHEDFGASVLLLKQLHVDDDVLRASHRDLWEPLWKLKSEIDPNGVFTSKFLENLRRILA